MWKEFIAVGGADISGESLWQWEEPIAVGEAYNSGRSLCLRLAVNKKYVCGCACV